MVTFTRTETQDALTQRFLRYSSISSQSDGSVSSIPTSSGQRKPARLLRDELVEAGASDIYLSETSVLTARIPSNLRDGQTAPTIGFCTHLDTVDVSLSPNVHARLIDYTGGDICLNAERDIWLGEIDHPVIARYAGDRILVTDGTSVLGADDKTGIASVMEAAVRLLAVDAIDPDNAGPHGDIYLSFVPDEEIGLLGVRTMDLSRFPVDFAFTLDSCELGEIVEATFNAGHARVSIQGGHGAPHECQKYFGQPYFVSA